MYSTTEHGEGYPQMAQMAQMNANPSGFERADAECAPSRSSVQVPGWITSLRTFPFDRLAGMEECTRLVLLHRFTKAMRLSKEVTGFCVVISLSVQAQTSVTHDTLNHTDSTGRKQGWWVEKRTMVPADTDTTETTISEGRYVNDVKDGDWVTRYEGNGVVAATLTYADSVLIRSADYDTHGRVRWTDHNDPTTGRTIFCTYSQNGVLDGLLFKSQEWNVGTTYHENGNIRSHWSGPDKRAPDQVWVFLDYWENGLLHERKEFIGERMGHGTSTRYYENGQKEYECHSEFGKLNGPYTEYDEKGNVTKVTIYINGVAQ